jgi:hypothetical protein
MLTLKSTQKTANLKKTYKKCQNPQNPKNPQNSQKTTKITQIPRFLYALENDTKFSVNPNNQSKPDFPVQFV